MPDIARLIDQLFAQAWGRKPEFRSARFEGPMQHQCSRAASGRCVRLFDLPTLGGYYLGEPAGEV